MQKAVTLNIDDLGLAPAVNHAVLQLAGQGRIQAASLMSLGQLSAEEAAALTALKVDVGLHFDLTGLAAQGSLKQVMSRSWRRAWPLGLLQGEVARQLDAFEDKMGRAPVFVDGHQHVHQFPQVREILLAAVLQRYGNRVYWRHTRPLRADAKSLLIYALGGWTTRRLLHSQGVVYNRVFGGVYDFGGDAAALAQRWQRWLAAAPAAGTVLMCHPAAGGAAWQDEILSARVREWQWLASDAFAEMWQQQGCVAQQWGEWADKVPS